MPNTYTQLYVQLIFAVKFRESMIDKAWKEDLNKYITGAVQNKGHKMLRVNGVADHIHIFLAFQPSVSISDIVKDIKVSSSLWINKTHSPAKKFNWQEGFGAFT
jgi:putative transposase